MTWRLTVSNLAPPIVIGDAEQLIHEVEKILVADKNETLLIETVHENEPPKK